VQPLTITAEPLAPEAVERIARGEPIALDSGVLEAVRASRAIVEDALTHPEPRYGINTGFGSLSRARVAPKDLAALQVNLIRSHAAGVGEPLPTEVVRATMGVLLASLARARSGVRVELLEQIAGLLNAGVTPVVPESGSVGASGDLAPLAHIAQVLIGEGEAYYGGQRLAGAEALSRASLRPLELHAKEGIALINGTHLMCARAALLCRALDRLIPAALTAAVMTLDACRGTDGPLDARVYDARNQPGPAWCAEAMRDLLAGSEIVQSHKVDDPRVQDPYSIRCAAVVIGAAVDALRYVREATQRELGAVTDNPLVFPRDGDRDPIVSAGNFHGMPIAVPLDTAPIAISHIAGISERRTYLILSARDPESGLPPYLSPMPGLHSGLMIAQYTAAACCNEIVTLCTPASTVNFPTSAGVEDYNSFGPRSGAKAARSVELARSVIAIELLCAAEALERQRPMKSGREIEAAHARIREVVRPFDSDRSPAPDIAAIERLIDEGAFGRCGW